MKKAAFYTLGCKVNQYETEAMEELFESSGYEIVDFSSPADVYVINTCTVTHMGDRKSRQMIRRAAKLNPDAVIAVTGCYAQTAPDEIRNIEGVNLVLGTKEREKIVQLTEALTPHETVCLVSDMDRNQGFEKLSVKRYSNRTRAYIKVQEGCNQYCSYCIIPYARGPIRSRDMEDVLSEIKTLADNGYCEVILTGIHVASYGLDKGKAALSELLTETNKIDKIRRIRLSSIEPMTLNQEFIDEIKNCAKLCRHFHISLQSGCDNTLKRMNRRYTTKQYKAIVDGLRSNYPDAAITTDIMVGFPGETDEEFKQTARFVEEIGFADAHIFEYSPRKGTPAAKRSDQIDAKVKKQREKVIEEITNRSRKAFLDRFVGKIMPVLFEREVENGIYEGKTSNYITLRVHSKTDIHGQIHDVRMLSHTSGELA